MSNYIEFLESIIDSQDWIRDSNCKNVDSDIFFEENEDAEEEAKKYCDGCPVRIQCLDWAMWNKIEYGIFGGLTAKERKSLAAFRARNLKFFRHDVIRLLEGKDVNQVSEDSTASEPAT